MNFLKNLILFGVFIAFISCGQNSKPNKAITNEPTSVLLKVDNAVMQLNNQIAEYDKIATLDHHRMAADEGVYTPPSVVTIFSNPKIEVPIVQANQLIGLDLPFKVLCYAEPDTTEAKVAFTSAEFIQKRHNIDSEALRDYERAMNQIIEALPKKMISNTDVSNVDENFGIVQFKSDFDFSTTVQNLRDIVMAQSDTKWFADVDYQKQASTQNIEVRPTILLLFGGPAPGGKAMVSSPKIGLDAFCQKLLVYENEAGEVWIAYNDIVAFAELYYQSSTKPQQMINQRLKMTFTKAVTNQSTE